MVLDHIVANANPYNLWFLTAEIDHGRASSVKSKFDKSIVDHNVCNVEDFLVDVLSYILGPWYGGVSG